MSRPADCAAPLRFRWQHRAARSLVLGFLAVGIALAGHHLRAAALPPHDSQAPVSTAADRMDLDDRAHRLVLSGHVVITQAELRLDADRTTLAYVQRDATTPASAPAPGSTPSPAPTSEGGGTDIALKRMDAAGHVVVTRGDERASGDSAIYDFDAKLITMLGAVELRRPNGVLNGSRLVIDLATDRATVDGQVMPGSSPAPAGTVPGRVTSTFSVAHHTP